MPVDERQPAIALKAATTGSPDTAAIFTSRQSAQSSSSIHSSAASTSSSDIPPPQDGLEGPPEWSFKSNYGFGPMSVIPIRSRTKEQREHCELKGGESVLGGSRFETKDEERSTSLPNSAVPSKNSTRVFSSEPPPQEAYPNLFFQGKASKAPIPMDSQMATFRRAIPSDILPVRSRPLRSSMRPHTSPSPGYANSAAESDDRFQRRPRASILTPLATILDSSVPPTRTPSPSGNNDISANGVHSSASASILRSAWAGDGPKGREERDVGVVIKKGPHTPHTLQKPRSRRAHTATGTPESQRIATAAVKRVVSAGNMGNELVMTSNNSPYTLQGFTAGIASTSRKETPIGMFRETRNKERERGFVMKGKKKHHPWLKVEVPYPRDYENRTVDQ